LREVCDLQARVLDVRSAEFGRGDFLPRDAGEAPLDIAFVCLPGGGPDLLAAVRLSELLGAGVPVVLRLPSASGLEDLLGPRRGEGVRAVGVREVLASPDLVLDATREALAQVIHEHYVQAEAARGATPADKPYLIPWHELPGEIKASNRSQAADIPAKLREVGCRLVPAGDEAPRFAFTEAEVDLLSRREHARWCAERRRAGWTYAAARDEARRRHPSLVPWDELTEEDKERDRRAVRHIPALAARAGFVIVRAAPGRV
jgi:hypothetical protein